jgi:DDE superfamily endonuclease
MEGFPNSIACTVQEKGWFNKEIILLWIEDVWKKLAMKQDEMCLVLLNEFQVHRRAK